MSWLIGYIVIIRWLYFDTFYRKTNRKTGSGIDEQATINFCQFKKIWLNIIENEIIHVETCRKQVQDKDPLI